MTLCEHCKHSHSNHIATRLPNGDIEHWCELCNNNKGRICNVEVMEMKK